ncbi:MAG: hypothetical protein IBJ00_06175 [Alphaproteobacteria bacterium]|nr:hypothetical protein [Alphaproteobacteria bacterium]
MDSPAKQLIAVGIGASAGALESFKEFFSVMSLESGMAFVLVQHLAPYYPSIMDKLLSNSTFMTVKKIEDKMPIKANHVYIIPPNKFLKLKYGLLRLESLDPPFVVRRTIDVFFRSLAEDKEEKAIGIILSGAGTDGIEGCRVIKERDGLVIAQDPKTAPFKWMPENLISSGLADYVLPIDKMPEVLFQHTLNIKTSNNKIKREITEEYTALNFIFAQLKEKTKDDFSSYKKGPLLRRIHRRMEKSKVRALSEYGQVLVKNSSELVQLHKDFMIGTTCFFRNPEAFEALAQKMRSQITSELHFRVWVVGCSTGEEAYSIAILLRENHAFQNTDIQIFATDIDEEALTIARQGTYSKKIEEQISPERLAKFFDKVGDNYCVKPDLRKGLIFTRHNLISDIPFCKLDLIICRNLLFYLEPEKQKEIIKLFHFSVKPKGYLFLGMSERMESDHFFEMVSGKKYLLKRI